MKKDILKSLEPKTKTLFRFKNSDTKTKFFGDIDIREGIPTTVDPTTTTSKTVTI